jgi:hypothetical protein
MQDTLDTTVLRLRLTEIVRSINHPAAPELLGALLQSPETFKAIAKDKECRDLLAQIATFFKDAEARYFAFRTIQKGLDNFGREGRKDKPALSLHGVKGNFLWCQKRCAQLFGSDKYAIREESLFELMDLSSRELLNAKFGPNLLNSDSLKGVVISYSVKGVQLVSKCTPVYYNNGSSSSRFGILVRTRLSRKPSTAPSDSYSPLPTSNSFLDSALKSEPPLTPSFLTLTDSELLQTPLSELRRDLLTPSPMLWNEKGDMGEELRLTTFSITPLLSSADELNGEKRQKMMENIREFMA